MDMPLPQRVSSVTSALLPPVLLPMPVESADGPATMHLLPPSFAEQASHLPSITQLGECRWCAMHGGRVAFLNA